MGYLGMSTKFAGRRTWKWGGAIAAWIFSPAQVDALNLKHLKPYLRGFHTAPCVVSASAFKAC